jgi:hypothetical protein
MTVQPAWRLATVVALVGLAAGCSSRPAAPAVAVPSINVPSSVSAPAGNSSGRVDALAASVRGLGRLTGSTGSYEFQVDLQSNATFIPDVLLSKKSTLVGAGSVDAIVDLSAISPDAFTVSPDGASVTVTVPAVKLEPPNLDLDHTYIYAQQAGLYDKIGDLFGSDPQAQQELYQLATQKVAAAAASGNLRQTAEANIRARLDTLLKGLGYQTVVVLFAGA